jgi:hypothetical protein
VDVEGEWDMVTGQAANSEGDRERIERRCRQIGKQISASIRRHTGISCLVCVYTVTQTLTTASLTAGWDRGLIVAERSSSFIPTMLRNATDTGRR